MNKQHKEVLTKVLVDFMRDLGHVDLIVHHLQVDGVLDDSDRDRILKQSIRGDKVRELLETLPRRGPNAFESFVKALKKHQEWFVTRLQTELEEVERSSAENLARKSDSKSKESAVHQKLEHDNKTLLLTVKNLKDKNSCLTKELEEVKEARKNETAAHEDLKSNNSRLSKELEEVKEAKENDELMVHGKLKSDYKILKTTNCSEVKNLQDSISRLEEEKKELEEARKNESAVHQKLEHDNKTLLLTVKTLKDKNSCLTKELEEVKEARKNETAAHEHLKANNSCLSKELEEVEEAKDDEKLKNEKLLNKYKMLTTLHCSEVKKLQDSISCLKKELDKAKEARKKEKQKNEKLKNDNETQKTTHCNEVKNLQDSISSLVRELDEVKEEWEKESASQE